MNMQKHFGFLAYYHTTDAGQLARSLHGARRKDEYGPVPEKLGAHLYHIGHDNPKGYIQRDAVSCRKDHRSSPLAHFAPGFDEEGSPISRTGYMHQCSKHSDCLACGRHPITSQVFKCQKRYVLYDTVMTDNENNLVFLNISSGSSSAFDPDLEDGAVTGKTGICVDIDSSYNEGCSNKAAAMIKDGAIGCMDGEVGKFLCGLSLDVKHGDLSTVSTSGNLFWPRVLIEGSEDEDGDGKSPGRIECTDPIDCASKCRMLERTSRNGAGAPPTCAMCNQYCSSNVVSTIMDLKDALFDDLFGVIRLIGVCFGTKGIGGCICNFISTLEPLWRRISTSEKIRCENGDPFELIVEQLNSQVIDWSQWAVNQLLGGVNHFLVKAFGWIGIEEPGPFDLVCFDDPRRPKKCEGGGMSHADKLHFEECENEEASGGMDLTCYYHRVHTICSDGDMLGDYNKLFHQIDGEEAQEEIEGAFGESFAESDPTLLSLVEQAQISTLSGPDLEPRRDICSGDAFASSMRLDQIITSCLFAMVQRGMKIAFTLNPMHTLLPFSFFTF
jgi:hypothetical protein